MLTASRAAFKEGVLSSCAQAGNGALILAPERPERWGVGRRGGIRGTRRRLMPGLGVRGGGGWYLRSGGWARAWIPGYPKSSSELPYCSGFSPIFSIRWG